MKFTPEVIAALQTLKDAAENDFERHRIAVLERDLTAPPTVEVIDDTHQKFDGVVYSKKQDGHYKKDIAIHQSVFRYYYGEIPSGYEIHHIDENKDNNTINNLVALTKSEHSLKHGSPFIDIKCPICGVIFKRRRAKKSLTCSKKCANKLNSMRHTETRICPFCNQPFIAVKSSPKKCCSHSCASKFLRASERSKHYVTKTCPVCGIKFERPLSNLTQTCSRKCGAKLRANNAKSKVQALPAVDINSVPTSTDLVATFLDNKTS